MQSVGTGSDFYFTTFFGIAFLRSRFTIDIGHIRFYALFKHAYHMSVTDRVTP
jgi:hypothetical protein